MPLVLSLEALPAFLARHHRIVSFSTSPGVLDILERCLDPRQPSFLDSIDSTCGGPSRDCRTLTPKPSLEQKPLKLRPHRSLPSHGSRPPDINAHRFTVLCITYDSGPPTLHTSSYPSRYHRSASCSCDLLFSESVPCCSQHSICSAILRFLPSYRNVGSAGSIVGPRAPSWIQSQMTLYPRLLCPV
jgi:hypothetical protein